MKFLTIQNLLSHYKVKSYKETSEGLVAIHKYTGYARQSTWYYFRFNGTHYVMTGTTLKFEY